MAHEDRLVDYLTGQPIVNQGTEAHRQTLIRYLVESKGYARTDLTRDDPLNLTIDGHPYQSSIDLVARHQQRSLMAIKCVAGSLASCEREICAAARLMEDGPLRFAVVSDGQKALVVDVWASKTLGSKLEDIPDREVAFQACNQGPKPTYSEDRLRRERLIFRTYDMATVHRLR